MENTVKVPVIGVVQVLQMLKDGKTREEIRVHYGITKTDLGLLFKHKDLIGKKTIKPKAPNFTIVEDEAPVVVDVEVKEEVVVEVTKATMEIVDDADDNTTDVQDVVVEEVVETIEEDTKVEEAKEEAKSTWT